MHGCLPTEFIIQFRFVFRLRQGLCNSRVRKILTGINSNKENKKTDLSENLSQKKGFQVDFLVIKFTYYNFHGLKSYQYIFLCWFKGFLSKVFGINKHYQYFPPIKLKSGIGFEFRHIWNNPDDPVWIRSFLAKISMRKRNVSMPENDVL